METQKSAIDAKTADKKSLGQDAPKSQVDTKVSAEAMLNPADNSVIERDDGGFIEGVKPGSSYPTAEAVQREAEAKQKLAEEKQAKADEELKKPVDEKLVTRSALDHGQESIVHPGAKPDPKLK